MYHEDVINGVMCWKDKDSDEWQELTNKQLTTRMLELTDEVDLLLFKLNTIQMVLNGKTVNFNE